MAWKKIAETIGLSKGGAVRNAFDGLLAGLGFDAGAEPKSAANSVAFSIAVVALAAKMAKADGVAVEAEAEAFERAFAVAPEDAAHIRRVYDLAKQDVSGFEAYSRQVAGLLNEEPELLRTVLECLFMVAAADGLLHPEEDEFLEKVAGIFGIPAREFASIRATYVADPGSPYEILGASPGATDAELKARHRTLVLENHPDRLAAKGVPVEFRCAAERRLAAINAAHDAILKERGLKAANVAEQPA